MTTVASVLTRASGGGGGACSIGKDGSVIGGRASKASREHVDREISGEDPPDGVKSRIQNPESETQTADNRQQTDAVMQASCFAPRSSSPASGSRVSDLDMCETQEVPVSNFRVFASSRSRDSLCHSQGGFASFRYMILIIPPSAQSFTAESFLVLSSLGVVTAPINM